MARKTISQAPVATPAQMVDAFIPAVDINGQEIRVPLSKDLMGTKLIIKQVDNTATINGRLASPGNIVSGVSISLTIRDHGTGLETNIDPGQRPVTSEDGSFTFTFPGLEGASSPQTFTVTAEATSFLSETIEMVKNPISVFTTPPSVMSTGLIGDPITVDVGEASNDPLEFQIRRLNGGVGIPGADLEDYTIQQIDFSDTIVTQVRVRNSGGVSAWVDAGSTGPIAAKDFSTPSVVISGSDAIGSKLSADFTLPDGVRVAGYTWKKNGAVLRDDRTKKRHYFSQSNVTGLPAPGGGFTREMWAEQTYDGTNFVTCTAAGTGFTSSAATCAQGSTDITFGGTTSGSVAVGQLVAHANFPEGTVVQESLGGNVWRLSAAATAAVSGSVALWSINAQNTFYTQPGWPGVAGGQYGPQKYQLHLVQRSTSSVWARYRIFLARVNAAGDVQGQEVQFTPTGGATAWIAGVQSGIVDLFVTNDFGTFADGDRMRVRIENRNAHPTSSSNHLVFLQEGSNNSWLDMPFGDAFAGLALGLPTLSTRADMATAQISLDVEFTNGTHTHVGNSNAITMQAAGSPVAAPSNTALPSVIADPPRVGSVWQGEPGAWSGSPTGFNFTWQVEPTLNSGTGSDIAGATANALSPPADQVGKRIRMGVAAVNGVGTSSVVYSAWTLLQGPAAYVDYDAGLDANSGAKASLAFKTLAMLTSSTVLANGSIVLKTGSVWNEKLPIPRSNITVEVIGDGAKPIIGEGQQFAIDIYSTGTPDAYPRDDITIKGPLVLRARDRCLVVRSSKRFKMSDVILDWTGVNPDTGAVVAVGSLENCQGAVFSDCADIELRNISVLNTESDGLYFDQCDDIRVIDFVAKPHQNGAADNLQTRNDGVHKPLQQGLAFIRPDCDMASEKTSSGKGNAVPIAIDNVIIEDGKFLGNNFCVGISYCSDTSTYRTTFSQAYMNTYSWLWGVGGYDNQPGTFRHQVFDCRLNGAVRGMQSSGTSVKNYTGPLGFRADMFSHDCVIADVTLGWRIDRPTTARIRGQVYHRCAKVIDALNNSVLTVGELAGQNPADRHILAEQYVYDGTAPLPTMTARGTVTGTRRSGEVLTATRPTYDLSSATPFFGRTVTRSGQWRRLSRMAGGGWRCDWIEGETALTYTQTDYDAGCIISYLDRIHIEMTDGTVTDLAWDAQWDSVKYDAPENTATLITRFDDGSLPDAPLELQRLTKVTTNPTISLASWAAGQVVTALLGCQAGATYETGDASFAVSGGNIVTTATPPSTTGAKNLIVDEFFEGAINSPKRNWGMTVTVVA